MMPLFQHIKLLSLSCADICLLRKKPQDLPASGVLLFLCCLSYFLSSFILAYSYQNPVNSLIVALTDLGLMVILTKLILATGGKSERWTQTGTALLGTGTIFGLLAIPVYYLLSINGTPENAELILTFMIWFLIVWNITVMAHILSHALSIPFAVGVPMALIYVFIISGIIISLTAGPPS